MASFDFIEPCEVKALLDGPDRGKTVIVDVRDEDYEGGHIRGCINVWSDAFETNGDVDEFVATHLRDGVQSVVVHCMLSQQRGPFAARRIAARLAAAGRVALRVAVMSHGFRRFVQLYPDMCDDVSPGYWRR